ncbi:uncharacterized protein LOC762666 isoform X2 [Strongylocentrotus purpuratus]|uniref:Uncharacterized protein n=1 Tax=Strongylocentrotus purpuratus TaxID=7668 RepID=A0A7M7SWT1_STRPU|nr:uncharacterized protein LOC762666 isoform X2 [Strongylocentrotus purpuratus]
MDVMSAHYLLFSTLLFNFQLATCRPIGWLPWRGPDPNQGAACRGTPGFAQYCDKFSSGRIKYCSPCNLEQLRNSDISFPDECAELPCPWRCPEEISDSISPAPNTSCELTTAALTTQDTTTLAPSTSYEGGSSTPTQGALSLTTSNYQSTKPSNTSDGPALPPGNTGLWVGVGLGVLAVFIIAIVTAFCMRKRRRRKPVPTSSSCEPMIGSNEFPLTPPQTPTSPEIIPGCTSVEITTQESNMFVKLDCNCGEDAIAVGPEGVTLTGLLPSTRYHIVVGTQEGDTTFYPKHHEVTKTLTDETQAVNRCNCSLHNLKTHIENNPMDSLSLKALFGRINQDEGDLLRALSQVLKVTSLTDVAGSPLFEEMIAIDSQLYAEEDSIKVYDIQRALAGQNQQVPQFVADICQKLSSIHEDCLPCKHLVCEVSRTSIETTV